MHPYMCMLASTNYTFIELRISGSYGQIVYGMQDHLLFIIKLLSKAYGLEHLH